MNKHFTKYFSPNILIPCDKDVCKIDVNKIKWKNTNSKLILVTSINPTPAGEGKTTTLIGLNDCFNFFKKKSIACLRQPSMGPFFGIKGGATGSGKSELKNSNWINSGFTGDFFAIESCNNLIQAMIENEIFNNSTLNIDYKNIVWNRCLDMNDRSLREISYLIKDKQKITTKFNITAASYLMACFCLAKSLEDLVKKIDDTIIAFSKTNNPIFVKDLKITNAIKITLERAFNPNLALSKYNNPILIHGGPFANIAHGCNSIIATKIALNQADYVFTEAGFGADLGMEKFLNIKCREANIAPNLIVLVITIKALIHHSGVSWDKITNKTLLEKAIQKGFCNVEKHIETIKSFNLNFCIVINKFTSDNKYELDFLKKMIKDKGYDCEISTMWQKGPKDNKNIFHLINRNFSDRNNINYSYELSDSIESKIEKIATKIYGAKKVILSKKAANKIIKHQKILNNYYICFAKTFSSLSSNPKKIGRPVDFTININDIEFNHSSKFIIPIVGKVFLMPGLPKEPNAKRI